MIEEAMQAFANLVRMADTIHVSHVPGEPDDVCYLKADGKVERVVAEHLCQHTVGDVATVVQFAKDFVEEMPEIWFDRKGVRCLLSTASHREWAHLPLKLSPQILKLQSLEAAHRWMAQKEAIFLLRTTFGECLDSCPDLLRSLRNVKWLDNAQGTSNIEHGKSSVGKSIRQEVSGETAVPEGFTLNVPVFDAWSMRDWQPVNVVLEINAEAKTFLFVPMPLSIEKAISNAEANIGTALRGLLGQGEDGGPVANEIAVYYGDAG